MTEAEKKQKIKQRYNRKIRQRIEQQEAALDEREIDLAVAKKLENPAKVERHKMEIANIEQRIEALKDKLEE